MNGEYRLIQVHREVTEKREDRTNQTAAILSEAFSYSMNIDEALVFVILIPKCSILNKIIFFQHEKN